MAPPMHSLALSAAAIAVALALHGCGGGSSDFHDAICQTSVEAIVEPVESDFVKVVQTKCKDLKNDAHDDSPNASAAGELEGRCVAAAVDGLDQEADAQKLNFTEQCLDFLAQQNHSGDDWAGMTQSAHGFIEDQNFDQVLKVALNSRVDREVGKISEAAAKSESPEGGKKSGKGNDQESAEGGKKSGKGDGEESEIDKESGEEAEESDKSKKGTANDSSGPEEKSDKSERLFDASIRLLVTSRMAAVPVILVAVAAAAGLAVVLRRSGTSRDLGFESLVSAENSEPDA